MTSKLLQMMFEHSRWNDLIIKADEKGINLAVLKQLCVPQVRVRLYETILHNNYEIAPPHIARIPKENGDFREVYVNEDIDRIVLTLINDCLSELFADEVHPLCKSYQKGLSSQETVQEVSREIIKLQNEYREEVVFLGYKVDLSKYFDNVKIEVIDSVFDRWEQKLGFSENSEPVINLLRKYYHNDLVFDYDKKLIYHFGSLKQGCSVAATLANVVLYDVDETLSKMDIIYYRYSDDILMIGKDARKAKAKLDEMLPMYGLSLNPKKVEELYSDHFFKFLGFNIKGNQITLSKNRVKKLLKEICKETIAKPWISPKQAKANIKRILYGTGDGYSWATSAFNAMQNCEEDVITLNNWIMDCIRICEVRYNYNQQRKKDGKKPKKIYYGMDDVGGIGVVTNLPDRTLIRGTGSKIKTAKERTEKEIEYYYSIGCLLKAYKTSKYVFEACVRGM